MNSSSILKAVNALICISVWLLVIKHMVISADPFGYFSVCTFNLWQVFGKSFWGVRCIQQQLLLIAQEKNFGTLPERHLCWSPYLIMLQAVDNKRIHHRCLRDILLNFFFIFFFFFQNTFVWILLLYLNNKCIRMW